MKINHWFLLSTAVYAFLVGVTFSHDWEWFHLESSAALWAEGWFVGIARLVTILTPFVALVVLFTNFFCDKITEEIRGEPEDLWSKTIREKIPD